MFAVIRFADGARMLVRQESLRNFEPIPPTTDAFPDSYFEGAWLRGDAYELKTNPDTITFSNFTDLLLLGTHARIGSVQTLRSHSKPSVTTGPSIGSQTVTSAAPDTTTTDIHSTSEWWTTSERLPAGHPLRIYHALNHSSATRALLQKPNQLSRIFDQTPIFLTETRTRNAAWLSRLRSSVNVSVCVEHLIPFEATVHWFANRNPVAGRPPPSVIRGEDLIHLQPVVPYPYLGCTARDIWYLQLQESDVMYDLQAYDCPEQLVYDWLTNNQSGLAAAQVPFDHNDFSSSTSAHLITSPSTEELKGTSAEVNISQPEPTSIKTNNSEVVLKTTPFWAQRTLLRTTDRRSRVISSPKHRLTHSEMISWTNQQHSLEVTLSDIETDDDDDSEEVVAKKGAGVKTSSKISGKQGACNKSDDLKDVTEEAKQEEDATVNSKSKRSTRDTKRQDSIQSDPHVVDGEVNLKTTTSDSGCDEDVASTACRKRTRKSTKAIVQTRKAQLPKLVPGAWVAVGLHVTQTEYDVRWQDGSLERGIKCADLLPVYFNIDEHDFFPGTLVSLKSSKETGSTVTSAEAKEISSGDGSAINESNELTELHEPSSVELPRNYGLVLKTNPKDRTCLVQWFKTETTDDKTSQQLLPLGEPEEAGVYELTAESDRQLNYGDILLVHTSGDTDHTTVPAGYVEDIFPETGKLLIHWVDGTKTEVLRSECLFPLDALLDDDEWSSDESDEFELDELTSESDSEWETVTNASDDESTTVETHPDPEVEIEGTIPYEQAVRQTADKVLQAYLRSEAARRLFSDRRTFVFWILRRFVAVPDELDPVVDQLGTLLAAVAVSPNYSIPGDLKTPDTPSVTKLVLTNEHDVLGDTSTTTTGEIKSMVGELLSPAKAWDYTEEAEAINVIDKLHSIRELMQEAFHLVSDYRFKKMYSKCNHRELFSEKHVEGILKSIEIDAGLSNHLTLRLDTGASKEKGSTEVNEIVSCEETASCTGHYGDLSADTHSLIPDQHTLRPEILMAMRLSQMKVLIVPDSTKPFTSTDENWRNRIHYCMAKQDTDADDAKAYMIVSSTLFTQLTRYLTTVHKRLIEQLTDFGEYALAWLGEVAPSVADKARSYAAVDELEQLEQLNVANEETPKLLTDVPKNECFVSETTESSAGGSNTERQNSDVSGSLNAGKTRRDSQPGLTVDAIPTEYRGEFIMEDFAPTSHRFYKTVSENLPRSFYKAWKRDNALLSTSLPRGIIVKAFADRMDLYSLLIVGPAGTPYEHGLFLFDIQLPSRYPSVPPQVHYYSFASERVNPNLYVEGHVCLSLLGTWAGVDSENWSAENSNLLQLVVSLQGLILNSQPYFNEAGFDRCRGTAEALERSRVYNESVVATLVQSMVNLLRNPLPVFRNEIIQHCQLFADAYVSLLDFWTTLDEAEYNRLTECASSQNDQSNSREPRRSLPDFPLAPVSKGLQISVRRHRATFQRLVEASKQTIAS
ncbi:hypothetical protein EG68_04146 [Paragonimus skrjabini miyazakii]|uniref:UBC core domain-containing protein n=1 Tax=Paragonimus skrjabini miyazakii TaxID=59628 RepID=A0A8S9YFQ3_9TREM|nr:hypothetical protein EG68_04146 [Paragonimus skrjabini miyazakii]